MSRHVSVSTRMRARVDALAAQSQRLFAFSHRLASMGSAAFLPTVTEIEMQLASFDAQVESATIVAFEDAYGRGRSAEGHASIDVYAADVRAAVHDAVCNAFGDLGFAVDERVLASSSMLWATQGDYVVAVEIGRNGELEMDTAGCVDGACIPVQTAIIEAVRRHGIEIDMQRAVTDEHGDPIGGSLFERWHQSDDRVARTERRVEVRRARRIRRMQ